MRKKNSLIILLLLATTLTPPIIQGTDISRHLDPTTLPQENPDPEKLFTLYYYIFHETASENFTGASLWLIWASKVEALTNLNQTLQNYYNSTDSEITSISDVKNQIDEIKILLKRLDPDTLTAIKNTLNLLNKANQTLNNIDSLSKTLGLTLKYPTTQLDNGVEEVRELLTKYSDQLKQYENQIIRELNSTKPILKISADKTEVMLGDIVLIQGSLQEADGTALQGRSILLYFDDEKITTISTNELGGIMTEINIPYTYKNNATIYAEYNPEGTDTEKFGRAVSNILIINLIWFQPTLTMQVPREAYPGMELRISGLLSHNGAGLIEVKITVTALGETNSDDTSRKGTFTTTQMIPENIQEGPQQIFAQSQPNGIFANASTQATTLIRRYQANLTVHSPDWILSGQEMVITGKVEAQNNSVQNTIIELRTPEKIYTVKLNVDGTFRSEIDLPLTLLTSTYTYQAISRSEPWIRNASTNGSVLVINPFTLLMVLGLVGVFTHQAAKRINNIKSRTKIIIESPTKIPLKPTKTAGEPTHINDAEPNNLRDLFQWILTNVQTKFNVTILESMTIREWLKTLRNKVDTPLYTQIEQIGLHYERRLYGTPSKDPEIKKLFDKIKELLK